MQVLRAIHQAAKNSQLGFDLDSNVEDLREANKKIIFTVRQNEDAGQSILLMRQHMIIFDFS